ncbi:hypothetical protein QCM77_43375, partial [Bradyrhizobium sp. SSUT18]|uniref:hypothetical protein n=1 Tax=Bradyrhizobium sp. SSUT18 TaxID=3040602 RepID=UPI002448CC19
VRKQAALVLKPAAHDRLCRFEMDKVNHQAPSVARGFFSRLLEEADRMDPLKTERGPDIEGV